MRLDPFKFFQIIPQYFLVPGRSNFYRGAVSGLPATNKIKTWGLAFVLTRARVEIVAAEMTKYCKNTHIFIQLYIIKEYKSCLGLK
jgi:hypothetical protein